MQLEDDLLQIETLRKIDIFDFDSIKNKYLLEDIKNVAKSLRLLRDEGSFSISETVIVIWGRCFWLFYCPLLSIPLLV